MGFLKKDTVNTHRQVAQVLPHVAKQRRAKERTNIGKPETFEHYRNIKRKLICL